MSDTLIVQFVGYEVLPLVREYRFTVRESKAETREFTVTISNASFDGRRARFQDAPDICSLRLHRELAADPAIRRIPASRSRMKNWTIIADVTRQKPPTVRTEKKSYKNTEGRDDHAASHTSAAAVLVCAPGWMDLFSAGG